MSKLYLLTVWRQQQVGEGRGVRVGEGEQRQRALQLGERVAVIGARLGQRRTGERERLLRPARSD